jgi:hypothetical protein
MDIAAARQAIADAVTAAGCVCTPYPPDSPVPPVAFIEGVGIAFVDAFCTVAQATFTLVVAEQRNDRESGMRDLEALLPNVVAGLSAIPGLVLAEAQSGTTQIGGQEVPAVVLTATATL